MSGSWRGRAVSESPTHTDENPRASARSASASIGATAGRPLITASRVGSKMPISVMVAASVRLFRT